MVVRMEFQIILLLGSINPFVHAVNLAKESCPEYCGDVRIPYPFGIGDGCYYDRYFRISCRNNSNPVLTMIEMDVLEISLEGTVRVNHPLTRNCDTNAIYTFRLSSGPFIFSQSRNRFVAVGCNTFASLNSLEDGSVIGGCMSVCEEKPKRTKVTSCNGIACCQTTIPSDLGVFNTTIKPIDTERQSNVNCKYAFIVEQRWLEDHFTNPILVQNMSMVPVVLEWGINITKFSLVTGRNMSRYNSSGYQTYFCGNSSTSTGKLSLTFTCSCHSGFEGNPYLQECTDIDECKNSELCSSSSPGNQTLHCVNTYGSHFCAPDEIINKPQSKMIIIVICTSLGVLVLLIGGWWSYKWVKKRKNIKRKEKFFKRNGGLLLQQQLSSSEVNVEKTKLFNSKDLEKATDRFNVNRILGQGGQGTVYKGMLVDGRIVAVKKSKVIDEGKLKEFINEVIILSQINHRNVVKLLGCCLETEVPLLVYEFIPNGTLSQYLYEQNEEFPPTWDMRLRIATEVAGALFYLHSAASLPIYHRDIKTTNILLDEKYRAKVADFGTARSITVDKTHLTTAVKGTFGYLDPQYFQSHQFTEKSDVYSFGVVLVELLTGEKAISSTRAEESKSLATYFIHSMEENNLFDILDARVVKDAKKEEIIKVANLAKMCLNLNRKKRPTMKEVAMQLEAVQMLQKAPNVQQKYEDVEYPKTEMYEQWDDISISTIPSMDNGASSLDTYPMLSI